MRFSFSGERCFRRCQRQYYFHDIAAWHNARDPVRREAYVLKQVKTLELWQGQLVHRAIEKWVVPVLQRGGWPEWDAVVRDAHEMAERQRVYSGARLYRNRAIAKSATGDDYCALAADEFGAGVTASQYAGVLAVVERAIQNLSSLEDFWREARGRSKYYAELPIRTSYEGAHIEGRIDLMFFRGYGKPLIVDWKISERGTSDAGVQTALYAWLLSRNPAWNLADPAQVELVEVRLLDREIVTHRFEADMFAELEDRLYRGISEVQEVFGLGKYQDVNPAHLAYAGSPGTCALCPFRSLCIQAGVPDDLAHAQSV